jgi:transposase-like protein
MLSLTQLPMRPELAVCPNLACGASARIGVHSLKERRYKCHGCGKTFAETHGTPLYGLKRPLWMVMLVLALLAGGCSVPAIVFAFGLDERTVADWQRRAGQHAKAVQEQGVCQGTLDLAQVQADEMYVKSQAGTLWMATAVSVFSRLFVWGAIAPKRDGALVRQVIERVRAAALRGRPILWAVDGFAAWTSGVLRVFRDPQRTGKRGRPPLVVWQYKRRCLTSIERRLAFGSMRCAEAIMQVSQVCLGVINTAYVERLNATFRTWLPALARRTRTPARQVVQLEAAMFWMGAVYNFCRVHATLQGTPAMAADLTDHIWSLDELLRYRLKRE